MHDEGSRLLFLKRHNFDALCGTSSIVLLQKHEFPRSTDEARRCIVLESGHTKIRANMARRGTPLTPLPFPGSIYILGTGENHSAFSLRGWRSTKALLKKLLNYRPFTKSIEKEFGYYPIE